MSFVSHRFRSFGSFASSEQLKTQPRGEESSCSPAPQRPAWPGLAEADAISNTAEDDGGSSPTHNTCENHTLATCLGQRPRSPSRETAGLVVLIAKMGAGKCFSLEGAAVLVEQKIKIKYIFKNGPFGLLRCFVGKSSEGRGRPGKGRTWVASGARSLGAKIPPGRGAS